MKQDSNCASITQEQIHKVVKIPTAQNVQITSTLVRSVTTMYVIQFRPGYLKYMYSQFVGGGQCGSR